MPSDEDAQTSIFISNSIDGGQLTYPTYSACLQFSQLHKGQCHIYDDCKNKEKGRGHWLKSSFMIHCKHNPLCYSYSYIAFEISFPSLESTSKTLVIIKAQLVNKQQQKQRQGRWYVQHLIMEVSCCHRSLPRSDRRVS